jgi:hypothetical protein
MIPDNRAGDVREHDYRPPLHGGLVSNELDSSVAAGAAGHSRRDAARSGLNRSTHPPAPPRKAVRSRPMAGGGARPLALERLDDYSEDSLLAEIRRVAALVKGPVFSVHDFRAHARCCYRVVWQRFGSWRAALERAGLKNRHSGREASARMKLRLSHRMSDDDLLAELRRIAREKGSDGLLTVDLQRFKGPGPEVFTRRFGSWQAALDRAGLKPCGTGRRYTDEQCIENLRVLWAHYGRQPRETELRLPPSTVSLAAYRLRWGTWRRALRAFVDRVNALPGDPLEALVEPWCERLEPRPPLAPAHQRHVGSVLRYAVLKRDRFRCVLCGDSPAVDPACDLEIDHIQPFSKGGKTVAGNLRTLCRRCNQGRGNRGAA